MHFIALHVHGSSNPVGITGNLDRIPMHSYFLFKDLITVFVFILVFSLFVFFSPNTLGHSDNYIPGNPMVTPPSINNTPLASYKGNSCEKETILTNENSSKEEIIKELNSNNSIKSNNNEDFRQIMNGLFQAEGHIGGELLKPNTIDFRPIVYISLNASKKSIELFKYLNNEFNNKLNYQVSLNNSGIYHIRIYTRKWDLIINKWIPYFNNCYGDKQRGFKILIKLYYIINNKFTLNNDDYKIKFIYLVYNIVDNSQRKLSLNDKINLVVKNHIIDLDYLKTYLNNVIILNTPKMNIPFILGFYLGDGTFNISIKHKNKCLMYIPRLRIIQKYTKDNENLLNLISEYLNKFEINSNVSYMKNNSMVLLTIESIKNIKLLETQFKIYNQYYFNKTNQMYLLEKACIIIGKVKFWREGNIILLSLIYDYNQTMTNYDKYVKIVNDYFDKTQSENYFISLSKNKEWVVTLPINVKPKQKYFAFLNSKSQVIMDKTEALKLAKIYRDKTLKNWLIDNKLI